MEEVMNIWQGVEIPITSALAEVRGDWSDSIPINTASKNPFADPSGDGKWVSKFAVEWYNACYGNIIAPDQVLHDVLAKAISCACVPVDNSTLVSAWTHVAEDPTWYKWDKISPQPLTDLVQSVTLSPEYLKKLKAIQDDEQITGNYLYSNDTVHMNFRKKYQILAREAEAGKIDSMLRLSNLIAYMGIMMLRNLSKDENQMSAGYLKLNFQDNITKLVLLQDYLEVPAPHPGFMTRASKMISKNSEKYQIMLSHCLALFVATEVPHYKGASSENIRAIVKAAALTHLEHTGMSVCSLFVRTMRALPATAQDLASNLNCSALKPSLVTLGKTFKKYGSTSKTWWWARAYHDGYLADLTWKNHQMLIVVLSSMLSQKRPAENTGIMESVAVTSLGGDDRFKAVAFAEAVLEVCYSFEVSSQNSQINEKYANKIRKAEERTQKEIEQASKDSGIAEEEIKKLSESLQSRAHVKKVDNNNVQATPNYNTLGDMKSEDVKIQKSKFAPGHVVSSLQIPAPMTFSEHYQRSTSLDDKGRFLGVTGHGATSTGKRSQVSSRAMSPDLEGDINSLPSDGDDDEEENQQG